MEISACPKCGSRRIYMGKLSDGIDPRDLSKKICNDCGYRGMPLIFGSEGEYKQFLRSIENKQKQPSC